MDVLTSLPIPIWANIVAAVLIPVLFSLGRRAFMPGDDRRAEQFRVDALARRLGLALVEGDPALNLSQAEMTHAFRYGGFSGPTQTRVLLQGEPFGRPMEFLFDYHAWAPGWASGVGEAFEHRLTVLVPAGVPAFEIVRQDWSGPRVETLNLPPQTLGERGLDAAVHFLCADPNLGRPLGPAVAALREHSFVHIRCLRGRLSSLATRANAPYAIRHIVETQRVLHEISEVLWRGRWRG